MKAAHLVLCLSAALLLGQAKPAAKPTAKLQKNPAATAPATQPKPIKRGMKVSELPKDAKFIGSHNDDEYYAWSDVLPAVMDNTGTLRNQGYWYYRATVRNGIVTDVQSEHRPL